MENNDLNSSQSSEESENEERKEKVSESQSEEQEENNEEVTKTKTEEAKDKGTANNINEEEEEEEEESEDDEDKKAVNEIIQKLLAVKYEGAKVSLIDSEIRFLIDKTKAILAEQPVFLELTSPISILGDVHGQYFDLLRLFDYGGYPPTCNYLFLGDYVDRGKQSIETICLLMAYKIKYPKNFFIIRGNHEAELVNRMYGFYDECKRRYSIKLWKKFTEMFNWLPISALIDDKILCFHGGLSPSLESIEQLHDIQRPTDVPESGLLCDILWSDPTDDPKIEKWGENDRGVSFVYSKKVIKDFLDKNSLDLICRAHQVVEDGYEFFADRSLVTVFSAPNYCGEYNNCASMMTIDKNLMCSFKVLKPLSEIDDHNGELPPAGEDQKI